jgi:thiamine transport system substrate-binding protein
MFVYPVHPQAKLPEVFTRFAPLPNDPVEMDPAQIEANRDRWVQAWSQTVLR